MAIKAIRTILILNTVMLVASVVAIIVLLYLYLSKEKEDSNELLPLFFATKSDAQDALDSLNKVLEATGSVSMCNAASVIHIAGSPNWDKYGWTDLSCAKILKKRSWYILLLPHVQRINIKKEAEL